LGGGDRAFEPRSDLLRPEDFYDLLRPLCSHLDIWHTHYNHVMPNHAGVVEWFKGSSLRPFYSVLEGAMREQYLAAYSKAIARAYSVRYDGKVILKFPRLFIRRALAGVGGIRLVQTFGAFWRSLSLSQGDS
jgi:trans-aconitate 2-methyltransferase